MKSLSLATLSLTFLLAASTATHAQTAAPVAVKPAATTPAPAPAPAPTAVKPAVTTPAPTATTTTAVPVAAPTAGAGAAPTTTASPAQEVKKSTDPEAQPITGYIAPANDTPNTKAMIQDLGVKLGGVIGLMLISALGWNKLRRRGVGIKKSGTAERNESRLLVMEKLHLNPQQVLYVVRYAERTLLVGASPQNLNLITDLSKGGTALASSSATALPAPLTEALKELEARGERVKPSPEPAIRTPRPVAVEDRFAGILDRLRAQEEPSMPSEYRVQQSRPTRTIAELDEDEEERLLAKSSRGSSLFRAASTTSAGDGR
ncbi:flagellar biosynthetic protein FliO [Armatimonas sp.]|uniref:flagellar biosynthetic protein FliO n=1 Tax=Armatimonas sp. TaxID=1872638 RepID=UPI003753951C